MKEKAPQTLVDEVKTPIEEVLSLSVQDNVPDVIHKGLYEATGGCPVAVFDGSEIVAITTAGTLRGQILPRSWSGPLGQRLARLPLPPETTARTRVADLGFLVQQVPDADWLLVVDDETGQPVGVLNRNVVLDFIPPPDPVTKVYRMTNLRLWGDPDVEHDYYFCPQENRYYASHAVHPDAQGRMRDRRGHVVQKHAPPDSH